MTGSGRFQRLKEAGGAVIEIEVDGAPCPARADDTVLTAVLASGRVLRQSEFGDGPRAGMCLMGACQDCWMWTVDGERLRACSTRPVAGMRLLTAPPGEDIWPTRA